MLRIAEFTRIIHEVVFFNDIISADVVTVGDVFVKAVRDSPRALPRIAC